MEHKRTVSLTQCHKIDDAIFDAVVLILDGVSSLEFAYPELSPCVLNYSKLIKQFNAGVHTILCDVLPSRRLILSFTGPLNRDYDDIRRISEAAKEGVSRAIKIGAEKPVVGLTSLSLPIQHEWNNDNAVCMSAILGAFAAIYVPLECREFSERPACANPKSVKACKVQDLGWFTGSYSVNHARLLEVAWALEEGRRVARDIGGSDPERMCPKRISEYLRAELVPAGVVTVQVEAVSAAKYPLAAAVDRGSSEHHRGCIIHLEYAAPSTTDAKDVIDLFLVGKGIVYDTGGHDLKVNGIMATMHRDKCGAAAVAGFFKTLSLLRPKNLNVHGSLAVVRNSIGENAYVSDEIVTSRAGLRVRVTNTDAEGRMVMTDLLCEAKEKALKTANPRLVTVATLTGHVILSYGPEYTGIISNGPARAQKEDVAYQSAGAMLGEMSEISTLRREDFEVMTALDESADLCNSARLMSGKRCRGHQSAFAFMINASGLDSHMVDSEKPLPYTHFDIAGSQGPCPGLPTAVPLLTLASRYLLTDLL